MTIFHRSNIVTLRGITGKKKPRKGSNDTYINITAPCRFRMQHENSEWGSSTRTAASWSPLTVTDQISKNGVSKMAIQWSWFSLLTFFKGADWVVVFLLIKEYRQFFNYSTDNWYQSWILIKKSTWHWFCFSNGETCRLWFSGWSIYLYIYI